MSGFFFFANTRTYVYKIIPNILADGSEKPKFKIVALAANMIEIVAKMTAARMRYFQK